MSFIPKYIDQTYQKYVKENKPFGLDDIKVKEDKPSRSEDTNVKENNASL